MAMGIPVITNTGVGDVSGILEQYNAGWLVEKFTTAEYERVTDHILKGRVFDAGEIRRGAREFYSLETAVSRYRKVYDEVLKK